MGHVLTFLGKGGTGRTTIAIAAAKQLASQGKRVLLASQAPGPVLDWLVGIPTETSPQSLAPNLEIVKFESAVLLERIWDEVKQMEAEYVRTPFFKSVFGQELGVLPGMDSALALHAIRGYDTSGNYDVVIYDGSGDLNTLRMLGMPEILSWYVRRFRQVLAESDLGKALSPFVQPVTSAVLTVNWSGDNFSEPTQKVNDFLDEGKQVLSDPNRVAAYLVTTDDPMAIAQARYLWGSAQQVNLTVAGVLVNQVVPPDTSNPGVPHPAETMGSEFAPLAASAIPFRVDDNWQPLMAALPDFSCATQAPKPIMIDLRTESGPLIPAEFRQKTGQTDSIWS